MHISPFGNGLCADMHGGDGRFRDVGSRRRTGMAATFAPVMYSPPRRNRFVNALD